MSNLKLIRTASGKTQDQVASDLNIPLGTYRNWEQGNRKLNEDTIRTLSRYFHVSSDMLIGAEEDKSDLVPIFSKDVYDKREVAMRILLENYFQLSTEDLMTLAKFTLFLKSRGSSRFDDADGFIF